MVEVVDPWLRPWVNGNTEWQNKHGYSDSMTLSHRFDMRRPLEYDIFYSMATFGISAGFTQHFGYSKARRREHLKPKAKRRCIHFVL